MIESCFCRECQAIRNQAAADRLKTVQVELDRAAAVTVAKTNVDLLDRMIEMRAVVDAAREFLKDPSSVNAIFKLDEAVTEHDKGLPS